MARSIVVLKLSNKKKNVIAYAQNVAAAMTNNAHFPTPTPSLATFQTDIAALSAAEAAVLSRTKGAVEARNAKLLVVVGDLVNLKNYVQTTVATATPADAESIIQSAGMSVRKTRLHDKPALEAKQGSVTGTVNLIAKAAGKSAAYSWQYSTDQKTWTSVPQTLRSKAGVSGLTAGTTYYFRVQPLTRTGTEDWSQTVSLIVK